MNPWKGLKGLPRGIWMLSLSTLVNRLGTMVMFFLTLYLVQGRGWRPEEAATAMALYGLGALAASPISGRLADRLGHRRILAWSLFTSALAILVIPYLHARIVLFPLIALWSALNQAFWPASMALITDMATPEQRKQAFVLHRLASNLGIAIGPAVGGIIAHYSFTALFWIDGITTLLGLIVLLVWVPATIRETHEGTASLSGWRDTRLLLFLLATVPAILVFTQIHGALPLWVSRDLGHGTRLFGLVFTLNTGLILLLEVALNTRLAAWTHGHQLGLGAMLIALGFGLTGFAKPYSILVMSVVFWSLGEMIFLPASSDAVAAMAPRDRRGEYMGLYSMTWTVALSLGPWLGLLTYAKLGPQILWAACGAVALISSLTLHRFKAHGGNAT
ncbi:MAG: MFS transporter [Holophaga sp.]|nr:MFS transporter [Holophaga sp.]